VLIRALVALLLSGGLVAIVLTAHASPPDPSWVGGIYDAGDYGDVIALLCCLESLPAGGRVAAGPLFSAVVSMHPVASRSVRPTERSRSVHSRAPPQP